ncbi:hypothetical protein RSAG8_08237, partial [Rhizoctonia solani AG-8 WAC10335]
MAETPALNRSGLSTLDNQRRNYYMIVLLYEYSILVALCLHGSEFCQLGRNLVLLGSCRTVCFFASIFDTIGHEPPRITREATWSRLLPPQPLATICILTTTTPQTFEF